MEIKEIPGFPGYFASTDGSIYSNTRSKNKMHKMSPYTDRYGYLVLKPRINGKMKTQGVHRLLAKTFIPNPENKPQVNHKNGIKTDNRLGNLEWATAQENTQHASDIGLNVARKGVDSNLATITEDQVREICDNLVNRDGTIAEVAERLGHSAFLVYHIARKQRWVHISCDYDLPDPKPVKKHLSYDVVRDICGMLNSGHKVMEIVRECGFGYHTVQQIKSRKRYQNISEIYLH